MAFNWRTERRWRNRPDRYAVPTQVLESAGFLPTDQPFTPRRRMQLLWQMGYWAAGLHLLLMVLLLPLGQLAPWQIDMPQSAGWLLVAWLPAGLGWVLPRSRFKAAARGTLALWAVTGVYACTQGQATLGLSLLVWAAYVALVTRKLR